MQGIAKIVQLMLMLKKEIHMERKGGATKSADFLEKFQTAFDPLPLIFGKLYCKFFIMDMVIFMQRGIGQIVSVNIN